LKLNFGRSLFAQLRGTSSFYFILFFLAPVNRIFPKLSAIEWPWPSARSNGKLQGPRNWTAVAIYHVGSNAARIGWLNGPAPTATRLPCKFFFIALPKQKKKSQAFPNDIKLNQSFKTQ
jgi:hypothetical protein